MNQEYHKHTTYFGDIPLEVRNGPGQSPAPRYQQALYSPEQKQ